MNRRRCRPPDFERSNTARTYAIFIDILAIMRSIKAEVSPTSIDCDSSRKRLPAALPHCHHVRGPMSSIRWHNYRMADIAMRVSSSGSKYSARGATPVNENGLTGLEAATHDCGTRTGGNC